MVHRVSRALAQKYVHKDTILHISLSLLLISEAGTYTTDLCDIFMGRNSHMSIAWDFIEQPMELHLNLSYTESYVVVIMQTSEGMMPCNHTPSHRTELACLPDNMLIIASP